MTVGQLFFSRIQPSEGYAYDAEEPDEPFLVCDNDTTFKLTPSGPLLRARILGWSVTAPAKGPLCLVNEPLLDCWMQRAVIYLHPDSGTIGRTLMQSRVVGLCQEFILLSKPPFSWSTRGTSFMCSWWVNRASRSRQRQWVIRERRTRSSILQYGA